MSSSISLWSALARWRQSCTGWLGISGWPNVHFAGFVNQAALPRVYAACDVFVLPSENETWGLAINEAMCAGLPIVASSEIGCVPDLVHDGCNGRTFSAGDVGGLTEALQPLLTDPELRRRMGESSRNIIARWSYAECQAGLRAALASVGLAPVTAERVASPRRDDRDRAFTPTQGSLRRPASSAPGWRSSEALTVRMSAAASGGRRRISVSTPSYSTSATPVETEYCAPPYGVSETADFRECIDFPNRSWPPAGNRPRKC